MKSNCCRANRSKRKVQCSTSGVHMLQSEQLRSISNMQKWNKARMSKEQIIEILSEHMVEAWAYVYIQLNNWEIQMEKRSKKHHMLMADQWPQSRTFQERQSSNHSGNVADKEHEFSTVSNNGQKKMHSFYSPWTSHSAATKTTLLDRLVHMHEMNELMKSNGECSRQSYMVRFSIHSFSLGA